MGLIPGRQKGNPSQYSCLKTPRKEEPGGLQPTGSQRVGHNKAHNLTDNHGTFVQTKKSSEQRYASDLTQISPLISFFKSQDAKWHFVTMTLYLASPITSLWFSLVFHDLDTCEEGQSGVLEKIPLLSDTTEVKFPFQGIASGVGYPMTHGCHVNHNHLIKGLPPVSL